MRFKLICELEKNTFPVDYRRIVLSYVKKALSEVADGIYYSKYFKDTIQKPFCFTVQFSKPKFSKEDIILEKNEINIIFTTDDKDKSGLLLQQAFLKQRNIRFSIPKENSITLKNVVKLNHKEINNSKVIMKTYDLCIRNHIKNQNKDSYYVFNDEGFDQQFKLVIKNQGLKAGFSKEISEGIKFTPINCKKVLVKHYDQYIDVTVGSFLLEGDPKFLSWLYSTGL